MYCRGLAYFGGRGVRQSSPLVFLMHESDVRIAVRHEQWAMLLPLPAVAVFNQPCTTTVVYCYTINTTMIQ